MYGGLISCVDADHLLAGRVGQAGGPGTTGKSLSMIKDTAIDFHWFPLDNPGIVSIPLAFLLGWVGTMTSKEHYERRSTPRWRSGR